MQNFDKIQALYGNRDIDAELIAMIGMITDSSSLIRQGESKEVRNMCTALEELRNESRQEGRPNVTVCSARMETSTVLQK